MSDNTEAQKVAELAVAARDAENLLATKFSAEQPFLLAPAGYEVVNLKEYALYMDSRLDVPRRLRKRIQFVDVGSFLGYVQTFRHGHLPRLFNQLTPEGLRIMCVFDYDEPGVPAAEGGSESEARTTTKWGDNIVFLKLAYSRDYQQLRAQADKWHKQEEFALFIEENTHLFVKPDGATMLELAQSLKGARNVQWESGKRLSNSSTLLSYIEQIDARTTRGEPVEVPDYLEMRLPMYEGFDEQDIRLAFRWRLNQDKEVNFAYRLLTKVAERKAETEVKTKVEGELALPLYTVSSFDDITPHRIG